MSTKKTSLFLLHGSCCNTVLKSYITRTQYVTLAMKLRLFAFCFVLKVVFYVCVMFLMSKYFLNASLSCAETTISKSFTGLVEQNDTLHI